MILVSQLSTVAFVAHSTEYLNRVSNYRTALSIGESVYAILPNRIQPISFLSPLMSAKTLNLRFEIVSVVSHPKSQPGSDQSKLHIE